MMNILKARINLKKSDPGSPLIYAYKITLNTFYGINRSEVFKSVHTKNSGSDCCWLGRQVNHIMENKMAEKGYNTVAADTDSIFIQHKNNKTREQVIEDLKYVVDYIQANVPFPQPTFGIDIENYLDYIMFVKDEKKNEHKKKNYAYIYTKKDGSKNVKIMGLPIKKVNATLLGPMIFKKHIKPRMLKEIKGKFEKEWVEGLIKDELEENMELMAQEYKANDFNSYSLGGRNCLNAQISKNYFNKKDGLIMLIKNTRIGKVGSSFKYCSLEEAKEQGLKPHEIDLTKIYNELSPFCLGGLSYKKGKKPTKPGFFNTTIIANSSAPKNTGTITMPELSTKRGFF